MTLLTNMETGRVERSLLPVILRDGANCLLVGTTLEVNMQRDLPPRPTFFTGTHWVGMEECTYTASGEFVISVDRVELVKGALFNLRPRPVEIAVNWAEINQ
jgi:hypothetical protein